MASNGEINTAFGIYRTLCCGQELVISVGDQFPDCPRHPKLTTEWKPVDRVVWRNQSQRITNKTAKAAA